MADPDKHEENIEDLLEIDGPEEDDETEDKDGKVEDIDDAENRSQRKKGPGIFLQIFSLVWKLKWIGLLIMLLLGALIAIGITVNSKYLEKEKPPTPISRTMSFDSLKEESLSPFFIPLTSDKNIRMVRVDLSVIWSALASVKYKKNELQIRDQMFSHLRLFTRDNGDSNNGDDLLENNLKEILQKSLGIYNLEVRVREINYF